MAPQPELHRGRQFAVQTFFRPGFPLALQVDEKLQSSSPPEQVGGCRANL